MGLLGAAAAASPVLAGCGETVSHSRVQAGVAKTGVAAADDSRFLGGGQGRPAAIAAVQGFSADLYQQIAAAQSGNVICSPYSVAVALAMARNGARGQTASEMDTVLHAPDLQSFNQGMNSLTRLVESRTGEQKRLDGSKATVSMDVANSLWGQRGEAWEHPFLQTLARYYGAGMRLVDYRRDPEAARLAINAWTSRQTHAKIPHLVPPGLIDAITRLVLVNAIYLKAPWETTFTKSSTKPRPFTLGNGHHISAPTMQDILTVSITEGSNWQAVQLPYAGRKLAMTVVVPGSSLADLEGSLDANVLQAMLGSSARPREVMLSMPTWKFGLGSNLRDALTALGMPTAFDPENADFSGMTRPEQLFIGAVVHDAFIAVDEDGTEAAAATAVIMDFGSAEPKSPQPFVVDRPFLFVIHDVDTATPLFVGRVTDPSAT